MPDTPSSPDTTPAPAATPAPVPASGTAPAPGGPAEAPVGDSAADAAAQQGTNAKNEATEAESLKARIDAAIKKAKAEPLKGDSGAEKIFHAIGRLWDIRKEIDALKKAAANEQEKKEAQKIVDAKVQGLENELGQMMAKENPAEYNHDQCNQVENQMQEYEKLAGKALDPAFNQFKAEIAGRKAMLEHMSPTVALIQRNSQNMDVSKASVQECRDQLAVINEYRALIGAQFQPKNSGAQDAISQFEQRLIERSVAANQNSMSSRMLLGDPKTDPNLFGDCEAALEELQKFRVISGQEYQPKNEPGDQDPLSKYEDRLNLTLETGRNKHEAAERTAKSPTPAPSAACPEEEDSPTPIPH